MFRQTTAVAYKSLSTVDKRRQENKRMERERRSKRERRLSCTHDTIIGCNAKYRTDDVAASSIAQLATSDRPSFRLSAVQPGSIGQEDRRRRRRLKGLIVADSDWAVPTTVSRGEDERSNERSAANRSSN